MKTNIYLDDKEIKIIRNYTDEMISLFNEKDMIQEGESIYLITEDIYVTREELQKLKKVITK